MKAANLLVEDVADDPLASASLEEVGACARLLAVSVAHHRVKFGVVPIATTNVQLGEAKGSGIAAALKRTAAGALEEALELVLRRQVEKQRVEPANEAAPVAGDENRHHMRISVTAPVRVSNPDGERECRATFA